MKKYWFQILMIAVFLSGCSLFWPDHPDPPDKPTPTPKIGVPAIVGNEFRVDGKRVMGMGVYDLISNADGFPDSSIDPFFQRYSDAGCNFMRTWIVAYFRPTDWIPFAWGYDSKIDLSQINPDYVNRFRMICQKAQNHGVCLGIVLWDFCTLRRGFGYAPPNGAGYFDTPHWLSPSRHIDPWANQGYEPMMTYHGFYEDEACTIPYYYGKPRTRRLYRCEYQNGQQSGPCAVESGSRLHPAWRILIDNLIPIAREYGHVVYIASEMGSGDPIPDNDIWDEAAKGEFIAMMSDRIKVHYPDVIIGNSLPDINYRLYSMTNISDIHGLGYGVHQDPAMIPESSAEADRLDIKRPICYNNDGWVNDSRFEVETMKACIRESWGVGGFFETKACYDTLQRFAPNIESAFMAMKNQR